METVKVTFPSGTKGEMSRDLAERMGLLKPVRQSAPKPAVSTSKK